MKFKVYIIIVFLVFIGSKNYCQTPLDMEHDILLTRKCLTGIGTVIDDTMFVNGKKEKVKRFLTIGSGLITYTNAGTTSLTSIITAKHVIKFFLDNNIKSIFIRPSWADTIKTTEYFGVEIPIKNSNTTSNVFLYPEENIDLGCIVMLPMFFDSLYNSQSMNMGQLGYNQMTTSYLGEQVWICGYPDHIDLEFQSRFFYSISTAKPGHIAWKPSLNMDNKDLNHITLIECNATHGNSGGPVFSLNNKVVELEGILISGYEEENSVYINNQKVTDSITRNNVIAKSRSGVAVIEQAVNVKNLKVFVESEMNKYIKTGLWK